MELFYKQNINNKKCSSTLQNMGLPLTNKKKQTYGYCKLGGWIIRSSSCSNTPQRLWWKKSYLVDQWLVWGGAEDILRLGDIKHAQDLRLVGLHGAAHISWDSSLASFWGIILMLVLDILDDKCINNSIQFIPSLIHNRNQKIWPQNVLGHIYTPLEKSNIILLTTCSASPCIPLSVFWFHYTYICVCVIMQLYIYTYFFTSK